MRLGRAGGGLSFVLRWPSKDPRDYQTVGRLAARRSRKLRTAHRAAGFGDPAVAGCLAALSRIVEVRKEDAVIHVDLLTGGSAWDGRPAVLAPRVDGASAVAASVGARPEHPAALGSETRVGTLTMSLN